MSEYQVNILNDQVGEAINAYDCMQKTMLETTRSVIHYFLELNCTKGSYSRSEALDFIKMACPEVTREFANTVLEILRRLSPGDEISVGFVADLYRFFYGPEDWIYLVKAENKVD